MEESEGAAERVEALLSTHKLRSPAFSLSLCIARARTYTLHRTCTHTHTHCIARAHTRSLHRTCTRARTHPHRSGVQRLCTACSQCVRGALRRSDPTAHTTRAPSDTRSDAPSSRVLPRRAQDEAALALARTAARSSVSPSKHADRSLLSLSDLSLNSTLPAAAAGGGGGGRGGREEEVIEEAMARTEQ
eukprot:3420049-Rhodomonas_salina.1